mgnify:CR=1 FL=1
MGARRAKPRSRATTIKPDTDRRAAPATADQKSFYEVYDLPIGAPALVCHPDARQPTHVKIEHVGGADTGCEITVRYLGMPMVFQFRYGGWLSYDSKVLVPALPSVISAWRHEQEKAKR